MNASRYNDQQYSASDSHRPWQVRDVRAFLDDEAAVWDTLFAATLHDAIQHLQMLIFEERWETIRQSVASSEDAIRESVNMYERGLADLFGFVRASGAPAGSVGWSTLKARVRSEARETETEITLRTALENGMYVAEQRVPLANHALYRGWTGSLMLFLFERAASAPHHPRNATPIDDQLQWAYQVLADIEEHERFHEALMAYLIAPGVRPAIQQVIDRPSDEIIAHEQRLLALPRFDLILNTGLRWLADAAARHPAVGFASDDES